MVRGCGTHRTCLLPFFVVLLTGAITFTGCGEDPEPPPPPPPEEDTDLPDAGDDTNNDPNNDPGDVPMDVEDEVPQPDPEPDVGEDIGDVGDEDGPPLVEDAQEDVPEDAAPDIVSECSVDDPCREGVCNLDNGSCEDKSPCFAALDCLDGEFGDRVCAGCNEGVCPDEGGTCRDRCETSTDCPEGQLCIDGGCGDYPGLECASDGDCQAAQICDFQGFACVDAPQCEVDEDCRGNRRCEQDTGTCRVCLGDVDCAGLQTCTVDLFSSICEEPDACLSDNDCQGLRFCDNDSQLCLNRVCQDDRFEPNNRINENTAFLREGVYTGLRLCGGEADLFLVSPPPGKPFVAVTRQLGGPLKMFVYPGGTDPFGQDVPEPIRESTGSDDRQGVFVPAVQQSVTYLLHVTSPVEGPKNYEMRILFDPPEREDGPCPEDELNNSPDEATQVQRQAPVNGDICADEPPGDEDWFRFQIGLNLGLELSLVFPSESDELEMDFFTRENNELVPLDVLVEVRGFGKVASFAPQEAAETVFLRVRGLVPEARNGYLLSLIVEEACVEDAQEPNNNLDEVNQLSIDPETGTAFVDDLKVCFNDVDLFAVTLLGGRGLQATTTLIEGGEGSPPSLSILEQQGEDFVPVGNLSSGVDSTTVTLGTTRDGGSIYLFEVQANVDGVTDYDLLVEVFDDPICESNDTLEPSDQNNVVPMPSTNLGAFLCDGEEDWYRVTATAGYEADISLSGPPGAVFDLRRLDDMTLLISGVAGRRTVTVADEGELAIVVRGDPGAEGSYSLTTNLTADPPDNDECEGVVGLADGDEVGGTLTSARDSITSPDPIGCFTLDGSPDVVYSFTLDARATVDITITPQGNLQPTVFIQEDCDDPNSAVEGMCATDFDDDTPFDGVVNLTGAFDAGTWFVWVDGATPGAVGDFDIVVEVQ